MYPYFDSRDTFYRSPCGAVPVGCNIHFKICIPRSLHCTGARLRISYDNTAIMRYDMFWCGMRGNEHEWWECDFTPETDGIYWYSFEFSTERHRTKFLGRTTGAKAKLCDHSHVESWQLTVYEASFKTPDCFKGGIIYQIFPDRFFFSGEKKENIPPDRKIHDSWTELPDWRPDKEGKITNNDYFGGDLAGITAKMDYLQSLGVTILYLNPIFEAHENHRYNTANYKKIDPMLGNEDDFKKLCREAGKHDISVILDGVFSHTGSDSIYFNKNNRYACKGAYNAEDSEYFSWYKFEKWPDKYQSWWGITTLPEIMEEDPSYLEYITGENGILRNWLRAGAKGWRLDVADELPDLFLDHLRKAVKAENSNALIIGEVWEDATNKEAYGFRRRYLQGKQLDSVMNYPFKDAILGFLTGYNAADMLEIIENVLENYPPQVINLLMNHIGTHDTERAITALAGIPCGNQNRERQSSTRLTEEQRTRGVKMMKLASLLQYTLPGIPSVYYGDEVGVEGYRDPFNRCCYPWGNENQELLLWYRELGRLRHHLKLLENGTFHAHICADRIFSFIREDKLHKILVAVNGGMTDAVLEIPAEFTDTKTLCGQTPEGKILTLQPLGFSVLFQ